ncbi:MAG: alpha/beta hydrolase-fold protein [Mycobacteriaceae bacterium]
MNHALDTSLISGPLWWVLLLAGPVALCWLALRAGRGWWLRTVPIALALGLGVGLLVNVAVNDWWQPFPDPLPLSVPIWVGLTAAALLLALRRPVGAARKTLAVLVVVAVAASGSAQVNKSFAAFPTVRSALGLPVPGQVDFAKIPGPERTPVVSGTGVTLSARWSPPTGMPAVGEVTSTSIPGAVSGFDARDAWIYLPPAYLSTPRARLPVLVLLSGQPGTPRDFFTAGHVVGTMNAYAAAHHGLAPVVVEPDPLGSTFANPLCVDSPLGHAFTYLSVDVPRWIRTHLQVDPDPAHWAVGGASFGGTCALQLAVNAPSVYRTFLDFSGQVAPTLGGRQRTLDAAFGGSAAAFRRVNPLDVMAHERFATSSGFIAVGRDDAVFRPECKRVAVAATAAGMTIRYVLLPGAHSWSVWAVALQRSVPFLGQRVGITS